MKTKRVQTATKRGRKSGEDLVGFVIQALWHIQDPEFIESSALGKLAGLQMLARGKYRNAMFPMGWSVKELLLDAVQRVSHELGELPGDQREVSLLGLYASGACVTEISKALGPSREHVSRTVRRRALSLVAKNFLAGARNGNILSAGQG
jgi:hypothetical protein